MSFWKSNIFVSQDVDSNVANEISHLFGIPLTTNLGKYLGIPSIHGRMSSSLYQQILDRLEARLEGWKTKYLSLFGRTMLAQSILISIPMYSMQTTLLPKGLCDKIDKLVRQFLWGD